MNAAGKSARLGQEEPQVSIVVLPQQVDAYRRRQDQRERPTLHICQQQQELLDPQRDRRTQEELAASGVGVVGGNPRVEDRDEPHRDRRQHPEQDQGSPPKVPPTPQDPQIARSEVRREKPDRRPADQQDGDRMGHRCQQAGYDPEGKRAGVALADTDIDGVRIHRREQEDQRPVTAELGVEDMQAADGEEQRTEQGGACSDQSPANKIERRDGERSEDGGQKSQTELVERHQGRQKVVEKVEQGSWVGESRVNRVPQHEDLITVESPVAQPQEAERKGEDGQAGEEIRGGGPATCVRSGPPTARHGLAPNVLLSRGSRFRMHDYLE